MNVKKASAEGKVVFTKECKRETSLFDIRLLSRTSENHKDNIRRMITMIFFNTLAVFPIMTFPNMEILQCCHLKSIAQTA